MLISLTIKNKKKNIFAFIGKVLIEAEAFQNGFLDAPKKKNKKYLPIV